jgi:plastocyanin domain-containing protein
MEIRGGVNAGDQVVTKGSFLVRAERERLGLRPPDASARSQGPAAVSEEAPRVVKVLVNDAGFQPSRIPAAPGSRLTLEFTRLVELSCATEVVVPSQKIRKALPLNAPVQVEILVPPSGDVQFACGMNMHKGAVVVQ